MRTLVFDGRTGAAGDMICAALVAAGADPEVLSPVTDRLPVQYEIGGTTKNGIGATTVDVLLTESASDEKRGGDRSAEDDEDPEQQEHATENHHGYERDQDHSPDHGHDHSSEHGHDHDHGHDHHSHDHEHDHHSHDHEHVHTNEHAHAEGAGAHRTYPEVVTLVESMALPDSVESIALDAFERLGRAEASVHGTDLDETHFHEVGADDAIADVVGAALLLNDLAPDRVVTTPVATGGGDVGMSHGTYPVPAPATTEIAAAADLSVVGGPVDRELLTPTGAAILAAVAEGVDRLPPLDVETVGYGAGDATFENHPNVLRVLVGDGGELTDRPSEGTDPVGLVRDDIAVLETNLDDAAPEVLGGLQETLADAGARDVTVVPTTMKKSRPGHLVKVICQPDDAEAVAERLARETGTLGVRRTAASHRWIAERSFETATLTVGETTHEVQVKVAATGLPIREVLRRAEATVNDRLDRDDRLDRGD